MGSWDLLTCMNCKCPCVNCKGPNCICHNTCQEGVAQSVPICITLSLILSLCFAIYLPHPPPPDRPHSPSPAPPHAGCGYSLSNDKPVPDSAAASPPGTLDFTPRLRNTHACRHVCRCRSAQPTCMHVQHIPPHKSPRCAHYTNKLLLLLLLFSQNQGGELGSRAPVNSSVWTLSETDRQRGDPPRTGQLHLPPCRAMARKCDTDTHFATSTISSS